MASSKRKEPLPAAAAAASRVLELEEELRNLAEELSQCQADKEFVWSLWKRLQVANPDLTQAISLVVEREKQKAEVKDRKILEILQVKDSKIQALEQRASGQQQEINNLVQRKIAVDEENALLKNEFSNLQQKFKDKSQELKDTKECAQKKEEQNRLVIKNLEEENEGLNARCADLLNDLEKLRKQEAQWRIEKSGIDAKIKNLETDLTEARKQMEDLTTKCSDLSSQVVVKQTELTQKDCDVARVRKELQELQNLYKQNTEHTAQQAELIQQLQALNMDTQKVLKNQEDAHTAETISYQKLYNELTICFETRKASEIQLQQSHASLQGQLLEKEQKIKWLEEQLQQAREALHTVHQDSHPKHREQEFQQPSLNELECLIASQKFEIQCLQEKLKTANINLAEHSFCSTDILESKNVKSGRKHEEPPVKRSRSLSPKSSFRESEELRQLKIAEKKIENLEKTLQLKTQENDELRKAHEKRKERLQMLQTNYRAVKEQLKQWEEGYSNRTENIKSKHQRADPHQLRQEDSDAVWNELAYFKREHKKLLIEKNCNLQYSPHFCTMPLSQIWPGTPYIITRLGHRRMRKERRLVTRWNSRHQIPYSVILLLNLEEELDQMKVCRSMDKATIQELNLCLQQEREELLFRLSEDDGVKNSTPKKNVKEITDQTLQKVCQLEKRFRALERESKKLKEVNKQLTKDKNDLKASIKCHKEDADTKERELEKLLKKLREIKKDKADLQLVIDELEREVTSLMRQVAEVNRLRNENEDLLCEVQQLKNSLDKAKAVATMATVGATHGQCNCKTAGTKVKLKAAKKKSSLGRHQAFLNQSIKVMSNVFENFNKDGWEDMSESSDSEIPTSESVGSIIMKTVQNVDSLTDTNDQQEKYQIQDNQMVHNIAHLEDKSRLYHKKGNTQNKDIEKSHSQRRKISPLITAHPSVINKVNREKRRNIVVQKPGCSVLLRERIKSLQQQIAVLQNAKRTTVSSVKEFKEANEKLTSQLHLADQRLQTSRRTIQTLTSDLAELQREREDLQGKLEHLAQATRLKEGLSPVTSNQIEVTPPTPSKNTDLELKQLYCKLKNANNEISKHSTTIKSLKNEAQEKEERMRELQEKVSRMERDINMKRHLIEDLRSRLKTNQETEKTFNETLESFEKKVKTLTEDCSNKKTSIDSLKQRLNVATKEKSQYEQMYRKAKDELGKKDLKLTNLEGKMIEAECAMTELETTASQQLHGLAKQSGQALEVVQKKMLLANDKVEEFITFVKALTRELQRNVQELRMRIRHAKKIQEERECNRYLSKESVHRAQSLAASILNISKTDLAEMLDTEDDEETERAKMEVEKDKEWLCYIQKLLEGQFPFASYLMDAVLEKLNEKKKLVEEYSSLMKQTI
ncbi:centlein isoform X1 [Mauremys reevesii]|uniref:centlein isoform X1 n=3 Tax=Mauremys reevesii TaxID=260615 RepID=UPI00193FA5AB|nr:centlein isoform X1 [Mauremys reevesii]